MTDEERRKVLCVAREKILSQRKVDGIKNERDKERHAAEFVRKRPIPFRS